MGWSILDLAAIQEGGDGRDGTCYWIESKCILTSWNWIPASRCAGGGCQSVMTGASLEAGDSFGFKPSIWIQSTEALIRTGSNGSIESITRSQQAIKSTGAVGQSNRKQQQCQVYYSIPQAYYKQRTSLSCWTIGLLQAYRQRIKSIYWSAWTGKIKPTVVSSLLLDPQVHYSLQSVLKSTHRSTVSVTDYSWCRWKRSSRK